MKRIMCFALTIALAFSMIGSVYAASEVTLSGADSMLAIENNVDEVSIDEEYSDSLMYNFDY